MYAHPIILNMLTFKPQLSTQKFTNEITVLYIMCVYVYTCTYVCMSECVCMYRCVYTCVSVYIGVHIHTQTRLPAKTD